MSRALVPPSDAAPAHPAVRFYTMYTSAALFAVVVCLADNVKDWWCLLPALLGGMALIGRWSLGPPMVLLATMVLLLCYHPHRWFYALRTRSYEPEMLDLILCAALLGYIQGHYRLLSLVSQVFPSERRRGSGGSTTDDLSRRDADGVSAGELFVALLALPLWTGAAALIVRNWLLDPDKRHRGFAQTDWSALLTAWALGAVLLAVGSVASYVRQLLATPAEALLYLQDQLWKATRREQSNLHRWLMWARLRAERRRRKP